MTNTTPASRAGDARVHDEPEGLGTILWALGVNVTVAAVKAIAGALSGSPAVLAEAAHSVVDCSTQLLLLAGERHGRRRARAQYAWGLAAAVVVFVSGGLYGLYEGVTALAGVSRPEAAASVAIAVLVGSSCLEATSMARAVRSLAASRGSRSWVAHLRTTSDTASKTVLIEDGSDVAGNLLAALGVALSLVTGWAGFDAAASVLVGVLLIGLATDLGRHNWRLLRPAAA